MTAISFPYLRMVKKRDIGRGVSKFGIWRNVTFERPLLILSARFSCNILCIVGEIGLTIPAPPVR